MRMLRPRVDCITCSLKLVIASLPVYRSSAEAFVIISGGTFSAMAQGSDVSEATQPASKVSTALSEFLKSSTWLYPIIRFLGHAIRRKHALIICC